MQLPFEPYQSEAIELADEVQDALVKVTENIHGYSLGIATYMHEMGTNHMFIKRLRDELAYQYQVRREIYHCTLETTITDCLFHLKQKKKKREKRSIWTQLRIK